MAVFDLLTAMSLVLGTAFGSSGIVAWYLTYLEMKNRRKETSQDRFRQLVLTPHFLRYLGALYNLGFLCSTIHDEKQLAENRLELRKRFSTMSREHDEIESEGVPFLWPSEFMGRVSQLIGSTLEAYEATVDKDFSRARAVESRLTDEQISVSTIMKENLGLLDVEPSMKTLARLHSLGARLKES